MVRGDGIKIQDVAIRLQSVLVELKLMGMFAIRLPATSTLPLTLSSAV